MAVEALSQEEHAARAPLAARSEPIRELRRRCELAGVLIDQVDTPAAVARIERFLCSSSAHQIVTVNLDFLSIAQRNRAFRETINGADLAVADGMPLVWMSRLQGEPLAERVTGLALVDESCRLAVEMDEGVFFLGAAPGVAEAAGRALATRFPGLRIAGAYAPPFGPLSAAEDERILAMIREAGPGIVFVALGAPLQDLWIRAHLDQLDVRLAMGVGCAFDILAGAVKRAPGWMQQAGLEWSYRLLQEPRRLWRRYLIDDIPMFGRLALASLRRDRPGMARLPQSAAKRPV
jgi:N-acetylglucosaminyldiphosphoundecaprenol N-acetyl-beta-D-mannosaminyltransferase